MLLSTAAKANFYTRGLRAGLPFAGLERTAAAIDAAGAPRDYLRRRRVARRLVKNSAWRGFLSPEIGLAPFGPGDIPGLEDVHLLARRIYDERKARTINCSRGRSRYNPFYFVLGDEDAAAYPALVEAALCQPLIEIMADYFGTIPQLQHVNIWMARPSTEIYGSQLFHLDKPDVHFVTVFINLFDVGPENGPTTALPAALSKGVRNATRYEENYYGRDGRLSDKEMLSHCQESELLSLTGPAGAGGICDTSTCLHYGSRCRAGERGTLVFRYAYAHKRYVPNRLPRPASSDPVRALFLEPG